MEYKEINANLFDFNSEEYSFAHCISADFAMGAGIALQFEKNFNTKTQLLKKYEDLLGENTYLKNWRKRIKQTGEYGDCIYIKPVFNLVTKEYYYDKPTYRSVQESLIHLRNYCSDMNIKKLAMPRIACGLDGLSWSEISNAIKKIFKDVDIEITVCYIHDLTKTEEICNRMEGYW